MTPLAAKVLQNEGARYSADRKRDQKLEHWYGPQMRRQKRRYARMRSRREPMPKGRKAKPWNDLACELVLSVCPSVRAMLEAPKPR